VTAVDSRPSRSAGGPERLLPFACIVSAAVLFASEFMTTFQLEAASTGSPLCDLSASDRHHYALAVLAGFAVIALLIAVLGGSKPAAVAVAIAGVGALLLFLIVDLPKANNVGGVSSACDLAGQGVDSKAVPQAGFWLEMAGALALAISGAALATLNSQQLRSLRPRWLGGGDGHQAPTQSPSTSGDEASDPGWVRRQNVDN
jgi:hypothetical protein